MSDIRVDGRRYTNDPAKPVSATLGIEVHSQHDVHFIISAGGKQVGRFGFSPDDLESALRQMLAEVESIQGGA
jgi:hypothetical protein